MDRKLFPVQCCSHPLASGPVKVFPSLSPLEWCSVRTLNFPLDKLRKETLQVLKSVKKSIILQTSDNIYGVFLPCLTTLFLKPWQIKRLQCPCSTRRGIRGKMVILPFQHFCTIQLHQDFMPYFLPNIPSFFPIFFREPAEEDPVWQLLPKQPGPKCHNYCESQLLLSSSSDS